MTGAGETVAAPTAARADHYRFIDYATQAYLGAAGLLILLCHNATVPDWSLLVGAHAGCMLFVHLLIRAAAARPGNQVLAFLRHFYPILLFPPLYRETGLLNRMFVGHYLDRSFLNLEGAIFGFQPSVRFMQALPWLPVSELFYAGYFSYYVMIVGVGIALYRRGRERFFHYVSIVSFVFYGCYLLFIALPVVGPQLFVVPVAGFPDQTSLPFYPLAYPAAVRSGPFFHIMALIYRYGEGHGGAFPSSHVAIALCTLTFTWRYLPRLRWVHLVAVVLLCMATVYCRYHYAVDIPAGALTAALLLPLGEYLYRRLA